MVMSTRRRRAVEMVLEEPGDSETRPEGTRTRGGSRWSKGSHNNKMNNRWCSGRCCCQSRRCCPKTPCPAAGKVKEGQKE